MISSSSWSSSRQWSFLQRALQVQVHLDVAVAEIHAELVKAFDQPAPVCTAHRLHAEGRDRRSPLVPLIPAPRGADLSKGRRVRPWPRNGRKVKDEDFMALNTECS